MRVAAVIPAYNEETRIAGVIGPLRESSLIDQIVLVSDGSTDATYETALQFTDVTAIRLPRNVGKGGAMVAGAKCASADILLLLDADLIGLTTTLAENLLEPVLEGRADMSIGVFRGGRWRTDWAQSIAPYITGQRAISRDHLLSVPDLETARFGAEMALGRYARVNGLRIEKVPLPGMTHPMKEEKLGTLRGTVARGSMYWEIAKFVVGTSQGAERLKQVLGLAGDE